MVNHWPHMKYFFFLSEYPCYLNLTFYFQYTIYCLCISICWVLIAIYVYTHIFLIISVRICIGFFCSTLRRWRNGQSIEFWDAHKAPIQAVIKLPSGELVTGITYSVYGWYARYWFIRFTCLDLIIALSNNLWCWFVFCHDLGSSDATLKVWRGKTCIHTFVGHTGMFLFSFFTFFSLIVLYNLQTVEIM